MNGQALLALLSDRPVAYHPDIARIVGSVKAAVFLCQLLYWTGKEKRTDGFIWKTQAEMEEETALTRCEQEGARKKLRALGMIEEKLAGIPAKLHYRVDTERLLVLIDEFYNNQDCGKPANCDAGNQQSITESTLENTKEHGANAPLEPATLTAEEELDKYGLGDEYKKKFPRQVKPTPPTRDSDGNWRKNARDHPWLMWGAESKELQRQKYAFGPNAEPVLRLGYELDRRLGLRPLWEDKKAVKTWTAGLVRLLKHTEGDTALILTVARQMREDGLSIKNPYSLEGMVADAMAKQRSGDNIDGMFRRLTV